MRTATARTFSASGTRSWIRANPDFVKADKSICRCCQNLLVPWSRASERRKKCLNSLDRIFGRGSADQSSRSWFSASSAFLCRRSRTTAPQQRLHDNRSCHMRAPHRFLKRECSDGRLPRKPVASLPRRLRTMRTQTAGASEAGRAVIPSSSAPSLGSALDWRTRQRSVRRMFRSCRIPAKACRATGGSRPPLLACPPGLVRASAQSPLSFCGNA